MSRGRTRIGAALVVGALLFAACSAGTPIAPGGAALSEEMPEGLELYRSAGCAACHGQEGEGGVGPALPGHTEEQVFRQVRTPIGDVMPAFPESELSDEDIRAIAAWIATLGDDMVMAHPEDEGGEDDHGEGEEAGGGSELTPTEAAHLRMTLIAIDTGTVEDAIGHIEHLALHGGEAELTELSDQLQAALAAGDAHGAEELIVDALGPLAEGEFDIVSAHLGMALSANDRGEDADVEFHLSEAAAASIGHDHEVVLSGLLDDWRSGEDRHGVVDQLFDALGQEHPPH